MAQADGVPDLEAALKLFDETVRALEARARRLEEVLTVKQQELTDANRRLGEKVNELDSLSRYLELVLSSVASGVVAVDAEGVVTTANPAARRIFASLDTALEGRRWSDCFADSAVDRLLAGEPGPIEGRRSIAAVGGGRAILEVVASPIVAPDGTRVGAVEVIDDITEVERLREDVARGERLKSLGEMAAGVAHEIRNPLNGIEGFASLLARDLEPETRGARHAQAIVAGVRDLNRTVTALLEFTRQRAPSKRAVPMDELLLGCVELVRAEGAADDALGDDERPPLPELFEDPRWAEGPVHCDPSQIRQVVLNLLQNAVQAAPGGQVRLGCRLHRSDEGRWCRIEVADSGPGIPAEQRGEVFTPFFTTKDHGTGLGLAIVHTIVQLHDGHISLDEDPHLGGARFTIDLPVSGAG